MDYELAAENVVCVNKVWFLSKQQVGWLQTNFPKKIKKNKKNKKK